MRRQKARVTRWTRNEARIAKKAKKDLERQRQYLLANWDEIYKKELDVMWFTTDAPGLVSSQSSALALFFDDMWVYATATLIASDVFKTKNSGYRASFANHWQALKSFDIEFNIQNEALLKREVDRRDLQLSDRDWSIARTTKKDVAKILQEWIREGQARQEVSKNIETAGTFASSRAKLIATQETWKAYGFWNHLPMLEAQGQGGVVMKKWETVHDAKVREDHLQNQSDWRILLDIPHSWTWDQYAPSQSSFNCRCTELYEIQ